jgi:hypothetical protein
MGCELPRMNEGGLEHTVANLCSQNLLEQNILAVTKFPHLT